MTQYFLNSSFFDWVPTGRIERAKIFGTISTDSDTAIYYVVLSVLAITLVGLYGVRRSRTGRALIALRDNERGAQAYALDATRLRLIAFAMSGAHRGGRRLSAVAASAGVRPEPVRPVRQPQRVHDGDRRRRRVACRRGARCALLPRHAVVPADRVAGPRQRHRRAADPAHHPGRVRRPAVPAARSLAGASRRANTPSSHPSPRWTHSKPRPSTSWCPSEVAGEREALAQPSHRQRSGARSRGALHHQRARRGGPRRLRCRAPRHSPGVRPRPHRRSHPDRDRLARGAGLAGSDRRARRSHQPRPAHVVRCARLGVLHAHDGAGVDARSARDRPIGCRYRQGRARPDAQLAAGRLLRHRRQAASVLGRTAPATRSARVSGRSSSDSSGTSSAGRCRSSFSPSRASSSLLRAEDARAGSWRVRTEGHGRRRRKRSLTEEPPPSFAESWRIVWKIESLRRIWYSLPFLAASLIGFASLASLLYDQVFGLDERAPRARDRDHGTRADRRLIFGARYATKLMVPRGLQKCCGSCRWPRMS